NTVNWVLGGFAPQQRTALPDFLADGADAVETVITDGLAEAQERFNGR
ncbi:MAG: aminoacyl-tRNA hydrolase, partial [Bifidobacterium mongoliense]